MSDIQDDLIDDPCTEEGCEYVAHGRAKGSGSAAWKLGLHKRQVHKIASPNPKSTPRKKRDSAVTEIDPDRPVLSVLQGTADSVGQSSGTRRKGAPTVDDLARGLGRGLGLCTIAVASYFAETDPTISFDDAGETQREALVDYLSLDEKAAREVMTPIARALAPTSINKRFGRQLVDNVDAVASVADIATLAIRYRHYFRQRNLRVAAMEGRVIDIPGTVPANGGPVTPPPGGPGASPPPQNGHVVGFDEVQRARGGSN